MTISLDLGVLDVLKTSVYREEREVRKQNTHTLDVGQFYLLGT